MSISRDEIIQQVRQFLRDNHLYMRPDFALQDDTSLLEERVIDSMGVMDLIAFIEQRFGVAVPDRDITEANLGSIAAIASYVTARFP